MLLPKDPKNIFSADMLRSGSTHIQFGIANLTGWRPTSLVRLHGEGNGEHTVNPITISILAPYGFQVFGGHHPAYYDTVMYLNDFKIKPMICIRNLYDTIISVRERIDAIYDIKEYPIIPGLVIPIDWQSWSAEEQSDWVAFNAGTWQLKFFASWEYANIEKLWVKYEEFYADQIAGWLRIFDFYELRHPPQEALEFCAMMKNNNFNKGVSGRGNQLPRSSRKILDTLVDSWGRGMAAKMRARLYA